MIGRAVAAAAARPAPPRGRRAVRARGARPDRARPRRRGPARRGESRGAARRDRRGRRAWPGSGQRELVDADHRPRARPGTGRARSGCSARELTGPTRYGGAARSASPTCRRTGTAAGDRRDLSRRREPRDGRPARPRRCAARFGLSPRRCGPGRAALAERFGVRAAVGGRARGAAVRRQRAEGGARPRAVPGRPGCSWSRSPPRAWTSARRSASTRCSPRPPAAGRASCSSPASSASCGRSPTGCYVMLRRAGSPPSWPASEATEDLLGAAMTGTDPATGRAAEPAAPITGDGEGTP